MYAGTWDSIQSILQTFGVTGASVTASAQAMAAPTLSNIQKVEEAFAAEGTAPPPEMMNLLYQRYYDSIYSNPFYAITTGLGKVWPWLLGGAVVVLLFSRRGSK